MTISGTNIHMTRGDTESISIKMVQDGEAKPFVDGDMVYFTVKRFASDTEKVLQKIITTFSDGVAVIPIAHKDTSSIKFGQYVYDIQVSFSDGVVTTLIKPSAFNLLPEVTHE